jgi:hypothetical protein
MRVALASRNFLATKDKDTHLVHNLGKGNDTDEDSFYVLSPDDNPNDGLDFDFESIRALESNSTLFLCDGKDHRIATCPRLTRIKSNDLAMRVCGAAIGRRRDSRPIENPPRKDGRPRQGARLRPDHHPQKVRGLQDSMTDLPVTNPWPRIFSKPVTRLSTQ